MTDEQLKPCPFCGGTGEGEWSDNCCYEWIGCRECGAEGPTVDGKRAGYAEAVRLWNQRWSADEADRGD